MQAIVPSTPSHLDVDHTVAHALSENLIKESPPTEVQDADEVRFAVFTTKEICDQHSNWIQHHQRLAG